MATKTNPSSKVKSVSAKTLSSEAERAVLLVDAGSANKVLLAANLPGSSNLTPTETASTVSSRPRKLNKSVDGDVSDLDQIQDSIQPNQAVVTDSISSQTLPPAGIDNYAALGSAATSIGAGSSVATAGGVSASSGAMSLAGMGLSVGTAIGGVALLGVGSKGASSSIPTSTNPVIAATSTTLSGVAIDGYLSGAKVYLIQPDGSKVDTGVTTDGEGKFAISNPNGYAVQIEGGTNTDTGLKNEIVLRAPGTKTANFVVTPLTTLIYQYVSDHPSVSLSEAMDQVRTSLGITTTESLLS